MRRITFKSRRPLGGTERYTGSGAVVTQRGIYIGMDPTAERCSCFKAGGGRCDP